MPNVHVEWGERAFDHEANVAIIVDCLSFSSALSVACARGATVYPFSLRSSAKRFADALNVQIVSKRGEGGLSLSPPSLNELAEGVQIVLPSPNGSNLTLLAQQDHVFAGALRNASAVARAALELNEDIIVVAAGERWPNDDSLRPAFEDWIAAGAIIHYMGNEAALSAEAKLAVASFNSVRDNLLESLKDCLSGQELIGRGFEVDVEWATQLDKTDCVPKLGFESRVYADLGLTDSDVLHESILSKRVLKYAAV